MRRLFPLFIVLLFLAACTSEYEQMLTDASRAGKPGAEDMFYATIEKSGEEDSLTKVYADAQMRVLWNAGDIISIFKKTTYNHPYRFTGPEGSNAGGFREVSTDDELITQNPLNYYYAVYPYREQTLMSYDGVLTVDMPAVQTYKEKSFGIGANTMVAVSEDNILQFKNVGGYLSFKFYGEGIMIKSITLKGNNHEKLAGKATITMGVNGTPVVAMQNDATEEVTLTCDTPVRLGTDSEHYVEFWFVLPPTVFSQGFTVTVNEGGGWTFEESTSNAIEVERNNLVRMSPMGMTPSGGVPKAVFEDENSYISFLTNLYMGFATSGYYGANGPSLVSGLDGGSSQYIRGLYYHSELTTDESVCGWNELTIRNFHYMNWTTDDSFIYAFYSRLFMQVSMANVFIREAKATNLAFSSKEELIAEARVLRAIAYFHAIDNFGNVPFVDETSVVGSSLSQISRADLFTWLEEELKDLINNSALAAPRANGYARADKGVAKFLLAKLYLNAEVYTGSARWGDCATVLNSLMSDGYSLHTTSAGYFSPYHELFLADNNRCSDEIIFAVEQDGVNITSYGATNFLIFASTGDGMDPALLGISSGWGALRTTPEFYDKFSSNDARNLFYTATQQKSIDNIGAFTNGYAFMKFRNRTSNGGYGQQLGFVDTDFPMMRYADVLLMAAECAARGASIDGLGAFNQVRQRAGLATVNSLNLDEILDERGRELYQECWRRNDLVRFGKFTSGYNWQWKGNVKEGKDVDSYRTIFPIPNSERLVNTGLEQNPGY